MIERSSKNKWFALIIRPEYSAEGETVGFQSFSLNESMLDEAVIAVTRGWLKSFEERYNKRFLK